MGETTEALSCQPDRKIVVQVMLLLRENPGDCKLVSLILLLGKVTEKIILGATEKFKKKKQKQNLLAGILNMGSPRKSPALVI